MDPRMGILLHALQLPQQHNVQRLALATLMAAFEAPGVVVVFSLFLYILYIYTPKHISTHIHKYTRIYTPTDTHAAHFHTMFTPYLPPRQPICSGQMHCRFLPAIPFHAICHPLPRPHPLHATPTGPPEGPPRGSVCHCQDKNTSGQTPILPTVCHGAVCA